MEVVGQEEMQPHVMETLCIEGETEGLRGRLTRVVAVVGRGRPDRAKTRTEISLAETRRSMAALGAPALVALGRAM